LRPSTCAVLQVGHAVSRRVRANPSPQWDRSRGEQYE
jgi:hypothetical protein